MDVGGRNDDGQLKTATLGGVLTVNHGYSNADNLGRIATINVTSGANPLLAQTFDFESVGNLKARSLTGGTGASARAENETFGYDTLDRLLQTSGTGITDTGSNSIDLAGNLSNKAGLLLGYQSNNNRLCAIGASTCGAGTGPVAYDANGNIQSYTRPTQAQSNNAPGADGAFLQLNGYTAFNLPTSITKSLGGAIQASAEFFYDAGYQRVRQIKRAGAVQTGAFADDILYVVPGGFEVHRDDSGRIIKSIATLSGSDGVVATVSTSFDAVTAQLPDGRLARFYELKTNKPLYFTKTYEVTFSDEDLPTHYGFKVAYRGERLAKEYERVKALPPEQLARPSGRPPLSGALAAPGLFHAGAESAAE